MSEHRSTLLTGPAPLEKLELCALLMVNGHGSTLKRSDLQPVQVVNHNTHNGHNVKEGT